MIFSRKYRISICENVVGTKFYFLERKNWIFGSWIYESHSMTTELKEAMALKCLKQIDKYQSGLHFYKPSHRCAYLNIDIK